MSKLSTSQTQISLLMMFSFLITEGGRWWVWIRIWLAGQNRGLRCSRGVPCGWSGCHVVVAGGRIRLQHHLEVVISALLSRGMRDRGVRVKLSSAGLTLLFPMSLVNLHHQILEFLVCSGLRNDFHGLFNAY